MERHTDPKITGVYAGLLSLTELGLGSLLHSLKVPLAGTFLSLNQSLFLTRITKLNRGAKDSKTLGFQVSNITALLKSLSPAGKKLLPMLAISAQGLLFSMGTLFFGANVLGCLVGAVFSSVWGIFQPLFFLWVVYGSTWNQENVTKLLDSFSRLAGGAYQVGPETLWQFLFILVALKALLAMGVVWIGWNVSIREEELLNSGLIRLKLKPLQINTNHSPQNNSFLGAFKDLLTPLFLIPFLITGTFFWLSNHDDNQWIWNSLKPLAIGYLIFLMIRLFPISTWVTKLGWKGSALDSALRFIEGQTATDKERNGSKDTM